MGFWDVVGKIAVAVANNMIGHKCPNCSSSSFKYGYSFIQEFGFMNMLQAGYSLATNNIAGVVSSSGGFFSGLASSNHLPLNPLLICNDCNAYFIICPDCDTSLYLPQYAKIGQAYSCSSCHTHFSTCASNEEFDSLVKN